MEIFFYTILFIFGTMFGSFASVVIHRLKSNEGGIWMGRSHCKSCERDLSILELIPIFSWAFQAGKCKGCNSKISAIYPILEISTGILFSAVGYFLIDFWLIFGGDGLEWSKLIFFLSIMFFTIVYVFYDILYLEIPESILGAANILTFFVLVIHEFGGSMIHYLPSGTSELGQIFATIIVCLTVIILLYYVMLAGLKELYDCIIVIGCILLLTGYIRYTGGYHGLLQSSALLSGTLAALGVYVSFFLQIIVSGGRWMGAGDLRIALLMGLLVGMSFAFPAWMITYLIGSIIGICIIVFIKIKNGIKSPFQHEIPFGPFIALGYLSILFFSHQISNFIEWYF